jgi:hypothetical protein
VRRQPCPCPCHASRVRRRRGLQSQMRRQNHHR